MDLVPRNRKSILLSTIMATMKSIYLFLSTPTLMPSSMSVGATLSARSTTNFANCFTLMMYLNFDSITDLKLGNNLLGIIGVSVDDLGAPSNLTKDC